MKFEYKLIITRNQRALSENELNDHGSKGWELISIVHHANAGQMMYTFKRGVI